MNPFTASEFARYIDHTLLKPDSTRRECIRICEEARDAGFAAACILPAWVADAADVLEGSGVAVCTVVGFPHGIAPPQAKASETAIVVADGATEVDMVLNISALKSGSDVLVMSDIEAVVEAAQTGGAIVKVILECALLTDDEKRRAARFCLEAGADFVKTSTGFAASGATLDDVRLLRQIVGEEAGVKAAGGIRGLSNALAMIEAGASRLGTSSGLALLQEFQGGGANTDEPTATPKVGGSY
ncbi:MAG: deoxyribose-phosphate aldolase [Cytophagales bacterium]|nr:deoxyribose-phosphate aldolase [Armatimonadota bacterium]